MCTRVITVSGSMNVSARRILRHDALHLCILHTEGCIEQGLEEGFVLCMSCKKLDCLTKQELEGLVMMRNWTPRAIRRVDKGHL